MTTESTSRSIRPDPYVLVAVDGSASSYQAVAWAAVDAALHHCRLHILNSMAIQTAFGPGISPAETELEHLPEDGERILLEATHIARTAAPGVDPAITTETMSEPIIPTLIARSAQAAMVVIGSRGLGAFGRGLLGSVSTAVTQHAHCPVAVIHGISVIDAVSETRPVLVGIDGSGNSVLALGLAFEEASRRKAGLVALHAWSDASGRDMSMADWGAARQSAEAELSEALAGYGERYPDVAVRRIVLADRPVRSLLDESANAQLVVVGSHGRGGFAGMILGSTSNALLHSVEVPIIIVRDVN